MLAEDRETGLGERAEAKGGKGKLAEAVRILPLRIDDLFNPQAVTAWPRKDIANGVDDALLRQDFPSIGVGRERRIIHADHQLARVEVHSRSPASQPTTPHTTAHPITASRSHR